MTRLRCLPRLPVAAPAMVLLGLLTGCGAVGEDDPFAAYCEEVSEQQRPLGEVLADGGGSTGFLDALPAFRDLAAEAPRDIRDEWDTVIARVEGLEGALEAAGVDPASYERSNLPEGVSAEERDRIDAAAEALAASDSQQAFSGVAQHARDVCHTPLYL